MQNDQPDGYLATPSTDQVGAVLVLHAWWGLNETIKALCRRLADAGFLAFAPDLYHGQVTDTIAGAERLSSTIFENPEPAMADVVAAKTYLDERAAQADRGLAVIGFSLGAYFALELSVSDPQHVRSVVVFYGTRPGDYGNSQAAYLGHFAENDEFESRAEVDALEAALRQAGRPVDFHHYPGTGHWFFEPDRTQAYDEAAAGLAWDRTLSFLRRPAAG